MSETQDQPGLVEQTIRDLLPILNEGFNWELVTTRYDNDPTETALAIQFTDETGKEPVEQILLGVAEGPRITILDGVPEDYKYLGSIVTYQDYGLRILDPQDPMDPDRARYSHNGVNIEAAEGESRERLWLVGSNVLETMLESVIWKRQQDQSEANA